MERGHEATLIGFFADSYVERLVSGMHRPWCAREDARQGRTLSVSGPGWGRIPGTEELGECIATAPLSGANGCEPCLDDWSNAHFSLDA